ncbi:hNH endonuclease [Escherichia coli]|nr:hNH endonuclease [Escherichia coli]ELM8158482.1 hNH endonuclease [Escherichia coli]
MKPDVKKIIADIKATKGNRKFCNGLAGTLQDDNYASSICKYVKTVTPERIDLLIEYAEKLEAEVTDMAVQLANAESKCRELAAENAGLKQRTQQLIDIISNTDNDYCMCGSAMKDHVHSGCGYPTGMFDYYYNQWLESDNKTPATDAFLAEVRAHDLNAFIRHHSAELDAHIKNGGEQFDEKSVRIRDIIVSARLFREHIRKEAAQ